MYQSIEQWLKEEHTNSRRITYGDNWMYWDFTINEWAVLTHPFRARVNKALYFGNDLNKVLNTLNKGMG